MHSTSRRFKAVLFDLYDTLVWLDATASARHRQALAGRIGVPLDRFLYEWRRSVNDRMLGRGNGLIGHLTDTLLGLGLAPTQQLLVELAAMERERLESTVHFYPGVPEMLQRLAAEGYRLGLVSNVSDGAAIPIRHLGIDRLFHELVLSHEVGLLKPDPAIFELACARLGVDPAEATFIADGGFGELDAAHALGIFSAMIEQDKQSRDFGASSRFDVKLNGILEVERLLAGPGGPA